MDYQEFLRKKSQLGEGGGFCPNWIPDFLFPFQQSLVEWAIYRGRSALFCDCGMGKTPMQLVWSENVVRETNKNVLIITPLAVSDQTVKEGEKFGIEAKRSKDGKVTSKITVTNYESLHKFDPADFAGVVCDESSILKHFSGATQKQVTRFMSKHQYRLLCTATAAPNDFHELGTSSEALGELGYSDMLTRFFKMDDKKRHRMNDVKLARAANTGNHYQKLAYRVSQQIGAYHLKPHAEEWFWRWIASWARACRKPSDLGFSDEAFVLPELIERHHIVEPSRPADGMLFTIPAFGLKAEREERRRSLDERCGLAAEKISKFDCSIAWCQMNAEGDLLEELIPNSIQVKGPDSDEWKEKAVAWFTGNLCICREPLFRAKLATWQKETMITGAATINHIANNAYKKCPTTTSNTKESETNTAGTTTKPTKTSGKGRQRRKKNATESAASDTPATRYLGFLKLQKLPATVKEIQTPDSSEFLPDMESHLSSTKSTPKMDAPFADNKQAAGTNAISDSTLTTAMNQESFEESSAPLVILDSASSGMIQSVLSAQQCICGHQSGRRRLVTKPVMFGWGLNLQNCHHMVIFASHSYEQYYQAIRRCWRFGQKRPVTVDVISSTGEAYVRDNMVRKSEATAKMFDKLIAEMNRSLTIKRSEYTEEVNLPSWLGQ